MIPIDYEWKIWIFGGDIHIYQLSFSIELFERPVHANWMGAVNNHDKTI